MFGVDEMATDAMEEGLTTLATLQRQGLIRHIGLSSVTPQQLAAGRRICQVVCVQNKYNLAYRVDDALIDVLAQQGIAYVPFFPLAGGFTHRSVRSALITSGSAREPERRSLHKSRLQGSKS
jgi:pyridoxine 4-dehydrogenase